MKLRNFFLSLAAAAAFATPALAQFNPSTTASVPLYSSEKQLLQQLVNPVGRWHYTAASGGITDTTAVTIKAAVTGKRNYLKCLQLSNSGAAGTEVLINDGAAGTTIWRGYIGPTNGSQHMCFEVPLRSTAGNLLEVKLSSGTTVAVRVNAQGWEQ